MNLPRLELNDGNLIPAIGLGTGTVWYKDGGKGPLDQELVEFLKTAIAKGFHHIDTAEIYGTEEAIGLAIKASGVPREQLFITTKVKDNILDIPKAIEQSLQKLQLDYVDLYMIHWPYFHSADPSAASLRAAWRAMEQIQRSGRARSIGVSNYTRAHLETTLAAATVVPAVHQLEFHPYLQRRADDDYIAWMQNRKIRVVAFKPLVALTGAAGGPLDGTLRGIAARHGVEVAAVLLRWQLQRGVVPVTTTRRVERLEEYAGTVGGLRLSEQEMEEISEVGETFHFRAWRPERFDRDDRT